MCRAACCAAESSSAGGARGKVVVAESGAARFGTRLVVMDRKRRSASNCVAGRRGLDLAESGGQGVTKDLQGRRFERCGLMNF